eukprot:GHVL01030641.1.p1 GENE.GHVL01030641.1~~GHVL01030641.1.p1  ORF type:complete len:1288 (+),score=169.17 GHVL01030641.1:116-3979(+)
MLRNKLNKNLLQKSISAETEQAFSLFKLIPKDSLTFHGTILLGSLTNLLSGVFLPLTLLYFGFLVGELTLSWEQQEINLLVVYFIILGIISAVVTSCGVFVFEWASHTFCNSVRVELLESLMKNRLIDQPNLRTAVDYVRDVNILRDGTGKHLALSVQSCAAVVAGIVYGFCYNWHVTCVCLSATPFVIILVYWTSKLLIEKCERDQNELNGGPLGYFGPMQQIFASMRTITSLGLKPTLQKVFKHRIEEEENLQTDISIKIGFLMGSLTAIFILTSTIAGFYGFTIADIEDESANSPGSVLSALFASMSALMCLALSISSFVAVGLAQKAAERIRDLVAQNKKSNEPAPSTMSHMNLTGDIVLTNVVLNNVVEEPININISNGSDVAMIGPRGVIESVILMIQGICKPISGFLTINGVDVDTIPVSVLRSNIGYLQLDEIPLSDTYQIDQLYAQKAANSDNINTDKMSKDTDYTSVVTANRDSWLTGSQITGQSLNRCLSKDPDILILDLCGIDDQVLNGVNNTIDNIRTYRASKKRTTVVIYEEYLQCFSTLDEIISLYDANSVKMNLHIPQLVLNPDHLQHQTTLNPIIDEIIPSGYTQVPSEDNLAEINYEKGDYFNIDCIEPGNNLVVPGSYKDSVTTQSSVNTIIKPTMSEQRGSPTEPHSNHIIWRFSNPYIGIVMILVTAANASIYPLWGSVLAEYRKQLYGGEEALWVSTCLAGLAASAMVLASVLMGVCAIYNQRCVGSLQRHVLDILLNNSSALNDPNFAPRKLSKLFENELRGNLNFTASLVKIQNCVAIITALSFTAEASWELALVTLSCIVAYHILAYSVHHLTEYKCAGSDFEMQKVNKFALKAVHNGKTIASLGIEPTVCDALKDYQMHSLKIFWKLCHLRTLNFAFSKLQLFTIIGPVCWGSSMLLSSTQMTSHQLIQAVLALSYIAEGGLFLSTMLTQRKPFLGITHGLTKVLEMTAKSGRIEQALTVRCEQGTDQGVMDEFFQSASQCVVKFEEYCAVDVDSSSLRLLNKPSACVIPPGKAIYLVDAVPTGGSAASCLGERIAGLRTTIKKQDDFKVKFFNSEDEKDDDFSATETTASYSTAASLADRRSFLEFAGLTAADVKIFYNGLSINELSPSYLQKTVRWTGPDVFNASIGQNILIGRPEANQDDMIAAARLTRVSDFAENFPKGYDTIVGDTGIMVGYCQRILIAIARAVIAQPSILVLELQYELMFCSKEQIQLVESVIEQISQERYITTFLVSKYLFKSLSLEKVGVLENTRDLEPSFIR